MSRLALGTVQFGLKYGVANAAGQVPRDEAARILQLARSSGIEMLDTAVAYGDSERLLGEIGVSPFRIVTKIPPLPAEIADVKGWVLSQVEGSLARLGVPVLHGVLLHKASDLSGPAGTALSASLNELKKRGLAEKVGVSVYSPGELDDVHQVLSPDIVQAPFNVIDRRLESSGWLQRLQTNSVEVHLRSAFLQGLLVMPRTSIPQKFERWSTLWDSWARALSDRNVSAVSACLGFALSRTGESKILVGVDTATQLAALIDAAARPHDIKDTFDFMACNSELLVNPSRWGDL